MRNKALSMGYSINEHSITHKSSGEPVNKAFKKEKDVFDFLELPYLSPENR